MSRVPVEVEQRIALLLGVRETGRLIADMERYALECDEAELASELHDVVAQWTAVAEEAKEALDRAAKAHGLGVAEVQVNLAGFEDPSNN